MAFITFITANWAALVGVLVALLSVAALIAKLTPTPKDDAIIAKILYVVNLLPQTARQAYEANKAPKKDEPTPVLK
jgi:hypothetical protein